MRDYWQPLARIRDSEFDQYLNVLEDTLDERIDELESLDYAVDHYPVRKSSTGTDMITQIEQNIYKGLMDEIDHIDTKTELFNYTREEITVSGKSILPGPLKLLTKSVDRMMESQRETVFQELFDRAKKEFRNEA